MHQFFCIQRGISHYYSKNASLLRRDDVKMTSVRRHSDDLWPL